MSPLAVAQTVLYDNGINTGNASGAVQSDLNTPVTLLADDFLISAPSQITSVSWLGAYDNNFLPADDFTVRFFNHGGGAFGMANAGPGSLITEYTPGMNVNRTFVTTSGMGSDVYSYQIPVDLTVAPGIYWISVYNDTSGTAADDIWRWLYQAGTGNHHIDDEPSFTASFGVVDGNAFTIYGITSVRSPDKEPRFLITDYGAIMSARTTGLMMPGMNRTVTHSASQYALRDLNERQFRMRSGLTIPQTNGDLADDSSLRYLDFAARNQIDYRVALGLADGEEIEIVDTLAAADTVWASHPTAMLGGPVNLASVIPVTVKAVVAVPEGAGKEVHEDKAVLVEPGYNRFQLFTEFDYGYWDQDNLTRTMRGFETDNYAGSLGGEYRLADWLLLGGAFTHTWSDTEATADLGSIDLEGQLLTAYMTALFGNCYLDFLYSYGDFDNSINRNTLLGSTARGDTDSHSHNFSVNLGHNRQLNDHMSAGPYLGLDYSNGEIDGYRESGGGAANLVYPDDSYESLIGRLGAHLTHHGHCAWGPLTTQLTAAWGHEFMPESDTVSTSLQTSPFTLVSGGTARRIGGFTATGDGAHVGTDWVELGAGVRLDFKEGWNVHLGYEGQFARNNASSHFGSVKLEVEW